MRTLTSAVPTAVVILLSLCPAGCDPQKATAPAGQVAPVVPGNTSAEPPPATPEPAEPAAASTAVADDVSLAIASFDELQATIASHKGKVVVVDYWSTQCEPCIKELPNLGALSHKYPRDQVVCITASLDHDGLPGMPVESCVEAPLAVLKDLKPASINVILKEDSLTVLDEKLKLPSIPIVVVYDTDGTVRQTFDESAGTSVSYVTGITPLVEKLVAERFSK